MLPPRTAGRHADLYHYALLYPTREELARAAVRLARTRTPIQGASDHRTHEAIYLADADCNGIELPWVHDREQWPADLGYHRGPALLDFDSLLAAVAGEQPTDAVGEACAWVITSGTARASTGRRRTPPACAAAVGAHRGAARRLRRA